VLLREVEPLICPECRSKPIDDWSREARNPATPSPWLIGCTVKDRQQLQWDELQLETKLKAGWDKMKSSGKVTLIWKHKIWGSCELHIALQTNIMSTLTAEDPKKRLPCWKTIVDLLHQRIVRAKSTSKPVKLPLRSGRVAGAAFRRLIVTQIPAGIFSWKTTSRTVTCYCPCIMNGDNAAHSDRQWWRRYWLLKLFVIAKQHNIPTSWRCGSGLICLKNALGEAIPESLLSGYRRSDCYAICFREKFPKRRKG